jgi:hypothetical protein
VNLPDVHPLDPEGAGAEVSDLLGQSFFYGRRQING